MTDPELLADETDDTAAELDDTMPEPGVDQPDEDDQGFSGQCVDGPYAGRTVTVRYPAGFLLADRAGNRAWLYALAAGTFCCAKGMPTPMPLVEDGRWRAAEGPDFDVLAYDPEVAP